MSYAHEDSRVVYPEIEWLKDQGFNTWFDEGISPGHEWREELGERIAQSHLFLYFVTPDSVVSEHCVREVNYALDQRIPLLVVHLAAAEMSHGLAMSLSSMQAIMRYELVELDYRIKLLSAASENLQRGIAPTYQHGGGTSSWRGYVMMGVGLIAGMAIMGALTFVWSPDPPEPADRVQARSIKRLVIDATPTALPNTPHSLAVTNDGSKVVFMAAEGDRSGVFTTLVGDLGVSALHTEPGAITPYNLALSPDNEWVAFYSTRDRALKKVRVNGGGASIVTNVDVALFFGLTWGPDDTIVYSTGTEGLHQVPASGGESQQLTVPAAGSAENGPHFLPDGSGVLYVSIPPLPAKPQIMLLPLPKGQPKLVAHGTSPQLTASKHLLFERDGTLWGAVFDSRDGSVGREVAIVDRIETFLSGGHASFSVSEEGTLVYVPTDELDQGPLWSAPPESHLIWVDRDGLETPLDLSPNYYMNPLVSPNGRRVSVVIFHSARGSDLWLHEPAFGGLSPLTFDGGNKNLSAWSPDAKQLAYWHHPAERFGNGRLLVKSTDGVGPARRLADNLWPTSWAPGGQIVGDLCPRGPGAKCALAAVSLGDEPRVERLLQDDVDQRHSALSPGGKWLAYTAGKPGEPQVYVVPFPISEAGGLWQVSIESGVQPHWGPEGKELFFLGLTHMMVAAIDTSSGFRRHTPRELFPLTNYVRTYSVTPDGQRFLMLKPTGSGSFGQRTHLVAHLDFLSELNRLLPRQRDD